MVGDDESMASNEPGDRSRAWARLGQDIPPEYYGDGEAAPVPPEARTSAAPASVPPGEARADQGRNPRRSDFTPEVLDKTVIAIPLLEKLRAEEALRQEIEPDAAKRARLKWLSWAVIIDLNLEHHEGREGARRAARKMIQDARVRAQLPPEPTGIDEFKSAMSDQYIFARLEGPIIRWLARLARELRDAAVGPREKRPVPPIYHIWPDFEIRPLTKISVSTVKADAARSSFAAFGSGMVWAVVDSGIDASHPHFRGHETLATKPPVRHYDFTGGGSSSRGPLFDKYGHGTHVAGIVAGEYTRELLDKAKALRLTAFGVEVALESELADSGGADPGGKRRAARTIAYQVDAVDEEPRAAEPARLDLLRAWTKANDNALAPPPVVIGHIADKLPDKPLTVVTRHRDEIGDITYDSDEITAISGMAPRCKLVSMKVLDDAGNGTASNIIAALEQIQRINGYGRRLLIHGVNLSVGYDFEPEWFACGQSPLCVEVDRLVKSGVVVVVAAGNTGYGKTATEFRGVASAGMSVSINDPGNAELAITVGSTHRYMPHVYGVSYFSSKGPTGDGRLKPDIVAPGEKIISCASGKPRDEALHKILAQTADVADCTYVEQSGTSMAAPHVSGVIAAFLSIRPEFVGRAEAVKQIFVSTATDLKRDRYFQGAGLVDLMRAIQSV